MPITIGTAATSQGLDYNVDIVMCIDATGSMAPIIAEVKKNALSFHEKFINAMNAEGKTVQKLRIKVITFRDFKVDTQPMVESRFFDLGAGEEADFARFVEAIEAIGGGDLPESSLEALALAIKSDWVKTGAVRRHVIMMYTDASAAPLGEGAGSPGYPADMPSSLAELGDLWESQEMEARAKRLLIFAPDAEPWSDIGLWTQSFHTPSKAGAGCEETDIDTCIRLLVKSI